MLWMCDCQNAAEFLIAAWHTGSHTDTLVSHTHTLAHWHTGTLTHWHTLAHWHTGTLWQTGTTRCLGHTGLTNHCLGLIDRSWKNEEDKVGAKESKEYEMLSWGKTWELYLMACGRICWEQRRLAEPTIVKGLRKDKKQRKIERQWKIHFESSHYSCAANVYFYDRLANLKSSNTTSSTSFFATVEW